MNRLIIVCKYYPYYPEFLQVEAPVLEKKYDEVDVFCVGNKYSKISQYIGKNFKIFHKKEKRNGNIFKIFKYLFIGFFTRKDIEIKNIIYQQKSILGKIYGLFEFGLAVSECKFILNRENVSEINTNITLYSFWFKDTAIALSLLKKKLLINGVNTFSYSRAHGHDLYEERSKYGLIFQEYCLSILDYIFPCSIDGENYLKRKYPRFASKIIHSYLGVNNDFKPNYKPSKDNVFKVVTCSNIVALKRLNLLIDELNELSKMINKKIVWVCIGNGNKLKELKKITRNQNFVFESKGGMKNKEIFDYYSTNRIDCFVNVSSTEGLPVSIMEAQSFGIVTIATNVGGTSEIVIDYKTGFLVPPFFKKGELAKKIFYYYQLSPSIKKEFFMSSVNNYNTNFNSTKNYEKFNNDIMIRFN